ncbi:MAG TPA: DUF6526 family protein [Ignavibacteria bacterium]|nr:DUF6526 family protein [Ignavibacteria bacterium]HMR41599.1 DUF6526 family protein [Ignavibacteria bacterium]
MKTQTYNNHKRYVFGFHVITFSLCFLLFLSSVLNLYVSIKKRTDMRIAVMFLITSLILLLLFYYARSFALKAQDRAIRNEVCLRYFVIAGKLPDDKLSMSKLLALRFAPDEEFPDLYNKTLTENLSNKDIKKAIKNWKSDYHRV